MTDQQTLPPATTVTGPGVYSIPEAEYHADPVPGGSLSSTGARKLLPPSCPAKFRHWLAQGGETKREWDVGSAAHKLVLGAGPKLVRIEGDGKSGPNTWNTNTVRDLVADARADGAIPLRPVDHDLVLAMAEALRRDPVAGPMLTASTGRAEQTLIWQDPPTGVWCRALTDFLPNATRSRFVLRDYKTGQSADPTKIGRTMGDFGYHVQLAFYLAGCRALGLAGDDAEALLIVQEVKPPYLVTVAQLDPAAMRMGAIRVRQALDLYAECKKNDLWPGYATDVVWAELPPWETKELNGVTW